MDLYFDYSTKRYGEFGLYVQYLVGNDESKLAEYGNLIKDQLYEWYDENRFPIWNLRITVVPLAEATSYYRSETHLMNAVRKYGESVGATYALRIFPNLDSSG